MCEGCEDEIAVKKSADSGWLCRECLNSYKNMNDDETQVSELSDEEIDKIVDEDESENDDENAELNFDTRQLRRNGFLLDEDEGND